VFYNFVPLAHEQKHSGDQTPAMGSFGAVLSQRLQGGIFGAMINCIGASVFVTHKGRYFQ
jgi:hypothetical protein